MRFKCLTIESCKVLTSQTVLLRSCILTWLLQLNVNAKQISSLQTQFLRKLRKRSLCKFAKYFSRQTCSGGIYTKIRAQRSNTVAQMPLPVIFIALDLESSSDFSPSSAGILQLSSKQTSWDRIMGLIMISEEIILKSLFFADLVTFPVKIEYLKTNILCEWFKDFIPFARQPGNPSSLCSCINYAVN